MPLYRINQKMIIEDNYRKLDARVKVALYELLICAPIRQSEFFIVSGDRTKAIQELSELGFITKNNDVLEVSEEYATMFSRQENYKYVKKSREKSKTQKIVNPKKGQVPCPYNEIVDMYHAILPTMPRIVNIDKSRERLIKARWDGVVLLNRKKYERKIEEKKQKDSDFVPMELTPELEKKGALNFFDGFFQLILEQPFIMGQSEGSRKAFTINQIFREDIFTKIIERAYK